MRTAIITGGAEGLGADIARVLAGEGYRLGILDTQSDKAQATADSLADAVALVADVTDAAQVESAFNAFGEVPDLLVNNAGIVRFGPLEEQSVDDFTATININFLGSCLCARQVAPGMLARGSGHIVNLTSIRV